MTNINLFESAQGNEGSQKNTHQGAKSFILPVAILAGVFIVLVATKVYFVFLEKEKNSIDQTNTSEMANLSGRNVDRIADFDQRMKMASNESKTIKNYNDFLKDLEGSMVSGAGVNSFSYSESAVKLDMVADNFHTVARQILSFKKSAYFKDLTLAGVSRDDKGRIAFSLLNK